MLFHQTLRRMWLFTLVSLLIPPAAVLSQTPAFPATPGPLPRLVDSSTALVNPLPAFFRSLVLPGWGQAVLDRKLTAGLFLAWEGVTLGMSLKTGAEVRYLQDTEALRVEPGSTTESSRLRAKRAEREDWIVLMAFNHLFSGLEAYVSAHLWDFPGDLHFQLMPGRTGVRPAIGLRLPLAVP